MKIFLSYTSKDATVADSFVSLLLNGLGLRSENVFYTGSSDTTVQAGLHWRKELLSQIELSDFMIALISDEYFAQQYCVAELAVARALCEGKLIPLRIGPPLSPKHTSQILNGIQIGDASTGVVLDDIARLLSRGGKLPRTWKASKERFMETCSRSRRKPWVGKWLQLKNNDDERDRPISIVKIDYSADTLKISGVSYDPIGNPIVSWPAETGLDIVTEEGDAQRLTHVFQAARDRDSVGLTVYDFSGDEPSGFYAQHIPQDTRMRTKRVGFSLKRLSTCGFQALFDTSDDSELVRRAHSYYGAQRIVLTGGPCSGKTTIASILEGRRPNWTIIPEAALAEILKVKKGKTNEEFEDWRTRHNVELQVSIFRSHLANEIAAHEGLCADPDDRLFILDRTAIDTIPYFDSGAGAEVPREIESYAGTSEYLSVFCLSTLPADLFNMRANTGRTSTHEMSEKMGRQLIRTYQRYGHRVHAIPHDRPERIADRIMELVSHERRHR